MSRVIRRRGGVTGDVVEEHDLPPEPEGATAAPRKRRVVVDLTDDEHAALCLAAQHVGPVPVPRSTIIRAALADWIAAHWEA